MGPPRFQWRHSKNHLQSTHSDAGNGCQDEDVSINIGNGIQDDNASFNIGNENQHMHLSLNSRNRNQDDNLTIDISKGTHGKDATFNVRDVIKIGRDAIDGVDAEVLELAQACQSLCTDAIFELSCIHTAL
jgi:hypothetical protein